MIEALGWALVHFLWQGAAIALLLALAHRLLRQAGANARYLAACAALLLMLAAPVATFLRFERPAPAPALAAAAAPASPLSLTVAPLATPPGPPPAQTPWLALIVAVWAAGVALLSVRMAGGLLLAHRLQRRAAPVMDREWNRRLDRLASRIGLRRVIRLSESALAQVPMAIGWLRPVILLPAGALLRLPPDQVEAVLAHELAHICRFDFLVNLFQTAVETLLFYHPAVWWVGRKIREEREHCCDDAAVAAMGDPVVYARALVELETLAQRAPRMAMAASGGSLLHRVKRLLGAPTRPRRAPGFGLAGLLGILALAAAWACAQPLVQNPPALRAQHHDIEARMQIAAQMPETRVAVTEAAVSRRAPILSIVTSQAPGAGKSVAPQANPPSPAAAAQNPRPAAPSAAPAAAQTKPQTQQKTEPGGSYSKAIADAGYPHLSVDQLIAFKMQGITPEYIRRLRAAGFHPTPGEILGMKAMGVTPDYAAQMKAAGYPDLAIHDLIAARAQGIDPETAKQLNALGFGKLSIHQLISARIFNVNARAIRAMKQAGFPDLKFRDVIAARVQGITPAYVVGLKQTGFPNLKFHDVIAARIQGVTPAFAVELKKAGFPNLRLHDVIAARIQKVTPAYVVSLKQAGFSNLDFHDLIAARIQGLTPEYVRGMREAGFPQLTFRQALRARVMGITPAFAREARAHGFKDLTIDKLIKLKMLGVLPEGKP